MSTTATRSQDTTTDARVGKVDMKLEVITIPVSDVDRAKEFYGGLGWRLDADFSTSDDHVVQFTPPGSQCSIHFGTNLTTAAPGSAQGIFLIVSDIQAARDELVRRGVEVSEVFHFAGWNRVDPDGTGERPRAGPAAATGRSRRSTTPTATAGCCRRSRPGCPAASTGATRVRIRDATWRSAFRRAEAAHGEHEKRTGRARRELARLVRRVHGGGAGGDGAAAVNGRPTMRADIVPGGTFPDYELPDHTSTPRRLSELQGDDPLILTLARGHYCPKEHQQHLELAAFYPKIAVAYTRIATIATDDHHTLQEFRASVGAQWTFLSDPDRTVQQDLDIQEYTDPEHDPMIPHTLVLKPGLVIHRIYNGYWFWGRPSVVDLWHDLRAVTSEIRPDWDLSTPGLREAWDAGDLSPFHGWNKRQGPE